MSNEALMDPADFAERLERGFGAEPSQAPVGDDVHRGKRRLLRRRAGTSLAALTTVGVVGAVASLVPAALDAGDGHRDVAPAAGAVEQLSRADVVERCTTGENVMFFEGRGSLDEQRAVALLGEEPRVMTWATVDNRTHATLLAQDGEYWGECQFRNAPDNGVKNMMSVYPTEVSFPVQVVDGVTAYEVPSVNDPRLEGSATAPIPDFETPCLEAADDEAALAAEAALCPQFTMHWNDRRPDEVAAVRVTTPDGLRSWADVRQGYLSFTYTGELTRGMAAQLAAGEEPGAARVIFYDKAGDVLVDDRDPGHVPPDGSISIENFPSLARWTKER